ncbi:hypothetical protein DFH09DRAFT_1302281 [Mycena vulgaris]|nr:hypothetical protein DFH09DRAFT_1302281 [Mycena vulgaris]
MRMAMLKGGGEGHESSSGLRHRENVVFSPVITGSALDESNIIIPYSPLNPLTFLSRVVTPSPHSTLSHATFRRPPPTMQALPTPEPSVYGSPAAATPVRGPTPETNPFLFSASSPHHVLSLSLSHPLDLDAEHDLELLRAVVFAARVALLRALARRAVPAVHALAKLVMLSALETRFEAGDDVERGSNADSAISGSSWASAGQF